MYNVLGRLNTVMIVNYFLKSNYPVDYQGNYDAQESKIRYIYIIVLHKHSKILLVELDQRNLMIIFGYASNSIIHPLLRDIIY